MMILCAVRKLPNGANNPNPGWWFAIDQPATAEQKAPAALHQAVVDADIHLLCRHGEPPEEQTNPCP